ncbi:MAG: methylthioribulose 1-phosphate dehydratase [Fluviicola sp.]|jgi:methylthioribulose-1-phosphate dehydratase
MKSETMKEQLAQTIRAYNQKGWSPATSTNYSFRIPEFPDVICVSRSGVDKSQFDANDFIEVDLNGQVLPAFAGIKPSAETLIHCTLYKLYPEMQCILHSHSVYSVLHSAVNTDSVALEGYELLKGYEGIGTHETAVELPIFDNTQDMVQFSQVLNDQKQRLTVPAFIMRKHGTYAWGRDLFEAKRHLETTEYLLEVEWKLR